jgi:exonuclease SbcD
MKLLHTSDWHLGRTLYGRKRYAEFEAFLAWLAQAIEDHGVDVLLVAGDVFDTTTPSNLAQSLYYRFLCRVASSRCRHVVVIAGNHDSPSFLDAPRELLKSLNVHVVAAVSADPADEVIVLRDGQGKAELIVCAVPYLRDRDIRTAEAGESVQDKERKLLEGIREHYAQVCALAEDARREAGGRIPVVGMGHLFTAGGQTLEGDGVRELYVGSLAHVSAGMFPDTLDYLALGHLHVPQKVGGSETRRYCGSPIPMGFGEAGQAKSVCLVELDAAQADAAPVVRVSMLDVPLFQRLARVRGDWAAIAARLGELAAQAPQAWVEIFYEGEDVAGDLRERLEACVADSAIEILRVRNNRVAERALEQASCGETLDDLAPADVFLRCLQAHEVPEAQRPALLASFGEIISGVLESDARAS